jgi:prepilin-type N-terminal cleavage/methylation domain-containing protein
VRRLRAPRRLRETRGFTLVELLVVMAITGVVFAAVSMLLLRGVSAESHESTTFQNQSDARVALDRMRLDVRCASAVSGTSASITLTLPAACGAGPVTWCTAATGTQFALYRLVGAGACTAGVRRAQYLTQGGIFTITQHSPTTLATVAVLLPISRAPGQGGTGYTLQDTLVLRNSTRG